MDTRVWSLAQIAERTGAKRRAIQLWADGGVLLSTAQTDRGGTGVHRQFESREVRIAALLAPLAEMGVPIGVLRSIGNVLRGAYSFVRTTGGSKDFSKTMEQLGPEIKEALDRADSGVGSNYLLLAHFQGDLWTHVATDALGPVVINPAVDFANANLPKTAAIIILDLTKILGSLLV